jgi:hypothetical protein
MLSLQICVWQQDLLNLLLTLSPPYASAGATMYCKDCAVEPRVWIGCICVVLREPAVTYCAIRANFKFLFKFDVCMHPTVSDGGQFTADGKCVPGRLESLKMPGFLQGYPGSFSILF